MHLTGIHHLTAVTADAPGNYRFYTQVMGMRLVKRSVNQDDISAYHLFYADAVGSPGTDLTFFDWRVSAEQRGTNSISRTMLRVTGRESLEWWRKRLTDSGVEVGDIGERDGRHTLHFEDPEGQRLALVDDEGRGDEIVIWDDSPVPAEHQIRGLGPIELSVPDLRFTDLVLREVTNMKRAREYRHDTLGGVDVHVYEMGEGGPHAEVHVAVQSDLPRARPGAGSVHHVAFRVPDDEYEAWAQRLEDLGVHNSGPVDRYYFKSLYFREPNGILFELATDGPGFTVDEDVETLGEEVALPPFLEHRRAEIEAGLKPIE